MSQVLAALDNSIVAQHVAEVARRIADLLGAEARALHVTEDGVRTAQAAATRAHLPFDVRDGDVLDVIADAAQFATVVVLGSRDRARSGEPVGHVARELMVRLATPVVLVPPTVRLPDESPTVLIPLDGSPECGLTLTRAMSLFGEHCEFIGVYVFEDTQIPAFGDQVHHEAHAWTEVFRQRHCRGARPVHLELRVGTPAEQVLDVAHVHRATLIAIGWSQELAPGRANTVRTLLARSTIPMLFFPISTHVDPRHRASHAAL